MQQLARHGRREGEGEKGARSQQRAGVQQWGSCGDPMGIQWGSDRISRDPGFLHYCQGHMKPRGSYPSTAPLYNINRGEFWERCAFFGGRGGGTEPRAFFEGEGGSSRILPRSFSGTELGF